MDTFWGVGVHVYVFTSLFTSLTAIYPKLLHGYEGLTDIL